MNKDLSNRERELIARITLSACSELIGDNSIDPMVEDFDTRQLGNPITEDVISNISIALNTTDDVNAFLETIK